MDPVQALQPLFLARLSDSLQLLRQPPRHHAAPILRPERRFEFEVDDPELAEAESLDGAHFLLRQKRVEEAQIAVLEHAEGHRADDVVRFVSLSVCSFHFDRLAAVVDPFHFLIEESVVADFDFVRARGGDFFL